jgi:hypothetical protein
MTAKFLQFILMGFVLFSNPVFAQSTAIELLCTGGFINESEKKEFQIIIETHSGIMWGFEPLFVLGFSNIDDKKLPWSKNFECFKNDSSYQCTGSNSLGFFSKAELSRYTGILLTTSIHTKSKQTFRASFKCEVPPKRKF